MRTASQAAQDCFPRFLIKQGVGAEWPLTYLDIGSHAPTVLNNSYMLEQEEWRGVSMDLLDFQAAFQRERRNPFVQADATRIQWAEFFDRFYPGNNGIHYLSFDIDDATEVAFDRFPWTSRKFYTITLEHDQYRVGTRLRDKIREGLKSHGYELVCGDVVMPGYGAFEDWYVYPDPERVHLDRVSYLRADGVPYTELLGRMEMALSPGGS